ncbi:MAG: hypothetical protein PHP53_19045 [Prolixibacteraceae bacterium]|nr:hypothetical protein [Prolixibacteraceae bacterium]
MIKRTTALFFILLANIVLLAHTVVPHHHHERLVCIIGAHCQDNSIAHNHNTSEHNHQHDGENSSESCALKQAVVVPINSLRHEFKCLGCDDDHSKFVHFQAILFSDEFPLFVPLTIQNAQIPLITSSHSNFVSASIGLRAPPVV